mmetsp:Transcript_13576/g.36453  ORF Transcript_13576/g.36453 Transcript_13576/m.36453 type:complete len:401 (+) Transcript_13576:771-1973(+)|eukprot:CAMPEP_0185839966 /NCGR_PEP_ID=MMETSP1353-20130828/15485_1 /TAXON_ID=1077150 /ORGANISM="Erythrolobus australicus, Strain CCMP3124" /LENGTH=400 /DNA_ID=CAMNT_0028539219 /DNA_START=729 /DNA_END=1934 /DNA_ORIENTATION=-
MPDDPRDVALVTKLRTNGVRGTEKLLDMGADPDADVRGECALHVAAQVGDFKIARLLLSRGAMVDPIDRQGKTPLHLAACGGHIAIVRALLEHGADISIKDRHGNLALHEAAKEGSLLVLRAIAARAPVGAEASWFLATNGVGDTLLHCAARAGNADVVRWVLMSCEAADELVSRKNDAGLVPLQCSEHKPHARACSVLLSSYGRRRIREKSSESSQASPTLGESDSADLAGAGMSASSSVSGVATSEPSKSESSSVQPSAVSPAVEWWAPTNTPRVAAATTPRGGQTSQSGTPRGASAATTSQGKSKFTLQSVSYLLSSGRSSSTASHNRAPIGDLSPKTASRQDRMNRLMSRQARSSSADTGGEYVRGASDPTASRRKQSRDLFELPSVSPPSERADF